MKNLNFSVRSIFEEEGFSIEHYGKNFRLKRIPDSLIFQYVALIN